MDINPFTRLITVVSECVYGIDRQVIIESAQELMNKNRKISLTDVAAHACLSRATVYRYYSNIDLLITEASIDIHHKSPEQLVEDLQGMELADQFLAIQSYYNKLVEDHETEFRRYLSVALKESATSKKKTRGARRPKTFQIVLDHSSIKLPTKKAKTLIHAATLLSGIDSRILCKDVNGLSSKETDHLLGWCLKLVIEEIMWESIKK